MNDKFNQHGDCSEEKRQSDFMGNGIYSSHYEEPKLCIEDNSGKEEPSINSGIISEKNSSLNGKVTNMKNEGWFTFETELKHGNIIAIALLHVAALYAVLTFSLSENLKTSIWMFSVGIIQALGITAGAHRLWTHRAYKAKLPLRIILSVFFATAGQNNLYDWVRDHRVHHKYTDTDADPHNSNRGFFFSHVGWLMMKKHSEVIRRGRQIDMSDFLEDPIAAFGVKYFKIFKIIFCFVLPILIPVYGWNETWTRAFISQILLRYVVGLNCTWSVNSLAHIWGSKPYNMFINPTENKLVALMSFGEGWHNYHHVFPWDYKAAELGDYMLNITTLFIDYFAKIGWAYDLKQPSAELVKTIAMKRGEKSHLPWDAIPYPNTKTE